MSVGTGTQHHRFRIMSGWVMILSLPFVLGGLICAARQGAAGFLDWIGSPFGAISLFIGFSATLWYCKLEFDEVILDYTNGGLQKLGLIMNKCAAFIAWAIATYVIVKLGIGAA